MNTDPMWMIDTTGQGDSGVVCLAVCTASTRQFFLRRPPSLDSLNDAPSSLWCEFSFFGSAPRRGNRRAADQERPCLLQSIYFVVHLDQNFEDSHGSSCASCWAVLRVRPRKPYPWIQGQRRRRPAPTGEGTLPEPLIFPKKIRFRQDIYK
jgi:hypothetical protein